MFSVIYWIGFVLSIAVDVVFYYLFKKGYRSTNDFPDYPKHYLTLSFKQRTLRIIGWATIWPMVAVPIVFTFAKRVFKF
jgi:hypothetical protein